MEILFGLDRGNGLKCGRTYRLNKQTGVCEKVGDGPAGPIWDLLDQRVASITLPNTTKAGAEGILYLMLGHMKPEVDAIISQHPLLKGHTLMLRIEEDAQALA